MFLKSFYLLEVYSEIFMDEMMPGIFFKIIQGVGEMYRRNKTARDLNTVTDRC